MNFQKQGRREGGRGGNFYRGPDRKRGPERVKFTSFWDIFQNFTGARIKSTILSTALFKNMLKFKISEF
jgi:hypothetical protein